jgi:integrase
LLKDSVRSPLFFLARPSKSQHDEHNFFVPRRETIMAKITDQFIRTLQVPEGKPDIQEFDDDLPGFGVRKFASGKVSLFVKYSVGKQQRRKTLGPWVLGTLPAIRKEAAVVLAQARLGKDVVGEAKKAQQVAAKAKTLGELVPVYLGVRERGDDGWKKLRRKSLGEVTRHLERAWEPLHGQPIEQITRQVVKARRDEIKTESGPPTANLAVAALSTFFGWAIEAEHYSGDNPTTHIRRLQQNKRKRTLANDELVDILACLDAHAAEFGDFGPIVKLLMLTGQRRQEIGALEWLEIPPGKRQIELPGERTKNHVAHIVPLSEPALALLEGRAREGHYVFGGNSRGFVRWSQAKKMLDQRIAERRGSPLPPWTIHDIRRTVATNLAESRERVTKKGNLELREYYSFAKPHIVEAVLNHVSGHKAGVAGVYNAAEYLPEKRDALEQWAAHLMGLLSASRVTPCEKLDDFSGQLVSGTQG